MNIYFLHRFLGIKIRFKGGTKCGYTKNILTGKPNNKNLTYYTSKQTLTKIEHVVMGPGILRPDFYKFSFSFPIDRFCPTSIEGIAGHIRYQVSLKIIHYNNYKNCYYKPVTVIQTNDLNDWLKIIMVHRFFSNKKQKNKKKKYIIFFYILRNRTELITYLNSATVQLLKSLNLV